MISPHPPPCPPLARSTQKVLLWSSAHFFVLLHQLKAEIFLPHAKNCQKFCQRSQNTAKYFACGAKVCAKFVFTPKIFAFFLEKWARGGWGEIPPKGPDPSMEKFFTMGHPPEGAQKFGLNHIFPHKSAQISPYPSNLDHLWFPGVYFGNLEICQH